MVDYGKISVIMSVRNCEQYLSQAIDSIINQTYENWEFVICNDCSTDGTFKICQEYAEKYPEKFILLENDTNRKLAYSLNRCLEKATGKFVARMDGDDLSHPERFEKQVTYLVEHPEVDLVSCAFKIFNEKGESHIFYMAEHPDKYSLYKSVPFGHGMLMTYKRVYDELNGYTVAKRTERGQDYDLWFRFFHRGFTGVNLQEALYEYRENDAAIKRRSFKVRWQTYQTTKMGYKLLNYPMSWRIWAFVSVVVKSLTPFWVQKLIRKRQAKKEKKSNHT